MNEIKCPRCGSTRIWSMGTQWKCAICRRTWVKNPKHRIYTPSKPRVSIPITKRCFGCKKFIKDSPIQYKLGKKNQYLCKECQEKIDRGDVSLSLLRRKRICQLCGKRILKLKNLKIIELKNSGAREVFGVSNSTILYRHEDCYKKLPLKDQRILEDRNFTHRCLDIEREIWVQLDEEGKMTGELFSDIPEEDKKLREIREETGITFVEYLKKGGSIIA